MDAHGHESARRDTAECVLAALSRPDEDRQLCSAPKWQPAHRLAVYKRSIDWFDFWLADRRDPDPAKKEQYRRWEALKVLRDRPRP